MVFLAQNTSLYRVHDFDPLTDPWSVFLHQPITIQHSVSDQFLGMVGRANIADQRKSPAGINYWYPACAGCWGNLVENSEMM